MHEGRNKCAGLIDVFRYFIDLLYHLEKPLGKVDLVNTRNCEGHFYII
jgi:hypothetical protein